MRVVLTVLVSLVASSLAVARSPQNDDAIETRIQRIENNLQPTFQVSGRPVPKSNIDDRLEELGIPGLSIAFVNNGKIQWAKGYGSADVSERRKVDTNTLFLAGSISKPFAALRIHQLSERGKIDLDANVNDYLSNWKVPENEFTKKEKVTLRRILNHTAGLTVWGFPGYDKGDDIPTVVEVLDGKGNTDPVRVFREPGKAWRYSGGGYTVMQLLTTDIEKTPYPQLMETNVLRPLGMNASTFENPLPEKYHARAATGYRRNGSEVEGKWPIYPEMAAAGLWTTPSQLIRYAIEIQRIRRTQKDGVLSAKSVADMLKPGLNGHGLGPTTTEHTFGHGGADEGFRATLVAWNDNAHALVAMVNSDNGKILQEVVQAVAAEYGLPGYAPDVRKPVTLSKAKREEYAGLYQIPNFGNVVVTVSGGGIAIKPQNRGAPNFYLPAGNDRFFAQSTGARIEFQTQESPVQLKIIGTNLVGNRIKKEK